MRIEITQLMFLLVGALKYGRIYGVGKEALLLIRFLKRPVPGACAKPLRLNNDTSRSDE